MGERQQRQTQRGIGLAAAVPRDTILGAARETADRGYHSFWLNNPPGADALQILGDVALSVQIWLGVGVIPLSDRGPQQIVQGMRASQLPLNRFYLGVGSGAGPGGVERVRDGIRAIRAEINGYVVAAALGPKMCRVAGGEADGVLLNWLTPQFATRSIEWVREGAEAAGRPMPRIMAYVRGAIGDDAVARLRKEAASYESFPAYASHFTRMGVPAMGTAMSGSSPQEVQEALREWDGIVDEVVVRVITANDTAGEIGRVIEAVQPDGGAR